MMCIRMREPKSNAEWKLHEDLNRHSHIFAGAVACPPVQRQRVAEASHRRRPRCDRLQRAKLKEEHYPKAVEERSRPAQDCCKFLSSTNEFVTDRGKGPFSSTV